MFLYCETSLHAGAGTGLGRIDLPIQREVHTGFPKIESSGLKGAIREIFEEKEESTTLSTKPTKDDIRILFGNENGESSSGSLGFTDARILLFPVRSAKGIFAWVTCPRILWQLKNDFALLKQPLQLPVPTFDIGPISINEDEIVVFGTNKELENTAGKVMLEEFVFNIKTQAVNIGTDFPLSQWLADKLFDAPIPPETVSDDAFHGILMNHLAIVHDDVFAHFVRLFTEVVTRNKIDNNTGIVQKGALFVEEYLPCNTVMYNLVLASPQFSNPSTKTSADIMATFNTHFPSGTYFQAGGNATIGKGILKAQII